MITTQLSHDAPNELHRKWTLSLDIFRPSGSSMWEPQISVKLAKITQRTYWIDRTPCAQFVFTAGNMVMLLHMIPTPCLKNIHLAQRHGEAQKSHQRAEQQLPPGDTSVG